MKEFVIFINGFYVKDISQYCFIRTRLNMMGENEFQRVNYIRQLQRTLTNDYKLADSINEEDAKMVVTRIEKSFKCTTAKYIDKNVLQRGEKLKELGIC